MKITYKMVKPMNVRQCIIKLSYTVDELLRGDSRGYFFGASSIIYVVLMAT